MCKEDDETKSIYNKPDIYDLHFNEGKAAQLRKHYELVFSNKSIRTIHDCSYGTGNLTSELARMGYEVSGSDISEDMLREAEAKNIREGLNIKLVKCDFRRLHTKIKGSLDCVMTTGNSLAHVNNADVAIALEEMAGLIKDKGYIYIDSRNWDKILKDKKRFFHYQPAFVNEDRINTLQAWDYNQDGTITLNILYSFEKDNVIYKKEEYVELYFPLEHELIIRELTRLGFSEFEYYNLGRQNVKELMEMDWYALVAQKI